MIEKLIVLNGSETYSFAVGKATVKIADSPTRKITKNPEMANAYIIFLKDGNEIDIISDKVIIYNKVGK
jgi:hypothetical protein